jgi:hypothetical protein
MPWADEPRVAHLATVKLSNGAVVDIGSAITTDVLVDAVENTGVAPEVTNDQFHAGVLDVVKNGDHAESVGQLPKNQSPHTMYFTRAGRRGNGNGHGHDSSPTRTYFMELAGDTVRKRTFVRVAVSSMGSHGNHNKVEGVLTTPRR